jgi:hypothetical protein
MVVIRELKSRLFIVLTAVTPSGGCGSGWKDSPLTAEKIRGRKQLNKN